MTENEPYIDWLINNPDLAVQDPGVDWIRFGQLLRDRLGWADYPDVPPDQWSKSDGIANRSSLREAATVCQFMRPRGSSAVVSGVAERHRQRDHPGYQQPAEQDVDDGDRADIACSAHHRNEGGREVQHDGGHYEPRASAERPRWLKVRLSLITPPPGGLGGDVGEVDGSGVSSQRRPVSVAADDG